MICDISVVNFIEVQRKLKSSSPLYDGATCCCNTSMRRIIVFALDVSKKWETGVSEQHYAHLATENCSCMLLAFLITSTRQISVLLEFQEWLIVRHGMVLIVIRTKTFHPPIQEVIGKNCCTSVVRPLPLLTQTSTSKTTTTTRGGHV